MHFMYRKYNMEFTHRFKAERDSSRDSTEWLHKRIFKEGPWEVAKQAHIHQSTWEHKQLTISGISSNTPELTLPDKLSFVHRIMRTQTGQTQQVLLAHSTGDNVAKKMHTHRQSVEIEMICSLLLLLHIQILKYTQRKGVEVIYSQSEACVVKNKAPWSCWVQGGSLLVPLGKCLVPVRERGKSQLSKALLLWGGRSK